MQLKPLTSIRFIFAILVVLYHFRSFLSHYAESHHWPPIISAVISKGDIGVNFFFVVSGFILSYSYKSRLNQHKDFVGFWWARFARIYPAYLLAFLVSLPFGIHSASDRPRFGLAVAVLQLTLTQSWVPAAAMDWNWNFPAWSLSAEAFFYAVFPFIFLRIQVFRNSSLILVAIFAYAASQVGILCGSYFGEPLAELINGALGFGDLPQNMNEWFDGCFPIIRLPEFIFGVAIGVLFTRVPCLTVFWRRIALLTGSVGLGISLVVIAPHVSHQSIRNGLLMPFLGLLLFGLAYSKSMIFNYSAFILLGDASYSVYLLHVPVWRWIQYTDTHTLHIQTHAPGIFFILYICTLICASLLSLKIVEEPARKIICNVFNPKCNVLITPAPNLEDRTV